MKRRRRPAPPRQAGFTLAEVLVALAIFAVIGAAGFAVLDQVIRVQRQTEGRLDRLGEIQRALLVVTLDFAQAESESVALTEDGLSLTRAGAAGPLGIVYRLEADTLVRQFATGLAGASRQALLGRVTGLAWRFWRADTGWIERWPPPSGLLQQPGNPTAVELSLALAGPGLAGDLRRIVVLPAEASQ